MEPVITSEPQHVIMEERWGDFQHAFRGRTEGGGEKCQVGVEVQS